MRTSARARARAGADVGHWGEAAGREGIYIVLLVRRSSDIEHREDGLKTV